MAVAFPGAYVDQSITERGPFDQSSEAVDVGNPPDLGYDRSYAIDRATTRTLDLSGQQTDPKPFPPNKWVVGRDPYAVGGGVYSYLLNSGG